MYLVSRNETFAKLFFVFSFIGLFIYVTIAFYTFHTSLSTVNQTKRLQKKIQSLPDPGFIPFRNVGDQKPKYILLWTLDNIDNPIGEGQAAFMDHGCLHQNCYITTDKKLLDYIDYDAIVFNVTDLKRWNKSNFPARRSPLQKYVFFGKQSSYDAPVCSPFADDFFNWTWSYKLYSDIFSPFIEVKDLKGHVIAPDPKVVWNQKIPYAPLVWTQPWTAKKKAVACILRKCGTSGKEMLLVALRLQSVFQNENLAFDIFGCKLKQCPNNDCLGMIKQDYYFYFVNEGSLAEDYVTDEVLTAFEAGVVPLVFGGADYSKFLPPGSYINARTKTPDNLAAMVYYAIKNPTVYQGYFRWKKMYTIHRTPTYKGICELCSMLHNSILMGRQTHYEMFRRWWYIGPFDQRCLKIESQNVSLTLSYLNESRGL